jgi:hypothetical protein
MKRYCIICGKSMDGEGDICQACKENIRAEAMGRKMKNSKEVKKESDKISVRGKDADIKKSSQVPEQAEEEEKKSHHFKSMAEYLEYLKGRKR